MNAKRSALIIGSHEYQDPRLRGLRAPAQDAESLARVLRDPAIGDLEVRTILDEPSYLINEAVEDFFADRAADDLLLLHFACHGVKDEGGDLHFATVNTKLGRLGATAVAADFVKRFMNRSRSRRIVLLLDCCYSGAFERSMAARNGPDIGIEDQLSGRGRAIITASNAIEYAFEGDDVTGTGEAGSSVFTRALVEGLETGDADRDQDGLVTLDELYDYLYRKVKEVTPYQTPCMWAFDVQGEFYIARRSQPVTTPAPLPQALESAIENPLPSIRYGAVQELQRTLRSKHAGLALAARLALESLSNDDSRVVSASATAALGTGAPPPTAENAAAAPPRAETAAAAVGITPGGQEAADTAQGDGEPGSAGSPAEAPGDRDTDTAGPTAGAGTGSRRGGADGTPVRLPGDATAAPEHGRPQEPALSGGPAPPAARRPGAVPLFRPSSRRNRIRPRFKRPRWWLLGITSGALTVAVIAGLVLQSPPSSKKRAATVPAVVKVGLVFDTNGTSDPQNLAARLGGDQARQNYGSGLVLSEVTPGTHEPDHQQLLDRLASQGDGLVFDLNGYTSDLATSALTNPKVTYVVVGRDPRCTRIKNLACLAYEYQEGSFLAGAAAALKSRSHTVGFIGVTPSGGSSSSSLAGYQAGIDYIQSHQRTPVAIVREDVGEPSGDTFRNGMAQALTEIGHGADVIYYTGTGEAAKGVVAACAAAQKYAIGFGVDMTTLVPPAERKWILTSTIPQVDRAVIWAIAAYRAGLLKGGYTYPLGLAAGAVGYAQNQYDKDSLGSIPQTLAQLVQKIIEGEIRVPETPAGRA